MIISAIFIAATAFALEETKPVVYSICQNNRIVRTIRVEKSSDSKSDPYVTIYTKNGQDRQVGSGQFVESNKKILENIKSNLQEAGWKCRDVNESRITEAE